MFGTEREEDSLYVSLVHLDSRSSGSDVAEGQCSELLHFGTCS